jgi:hypothetical protein
MHAGVLADLGAIFLHLVRDFDEATDQTYDQIQVCAIHNWQNPAQGEGRLV